MKKTGRKRVYRLSAIGLLIVMLAFGFYQERVKIGMNFYLDLGDRVSGFYNESPEKREELFFQYRHRMNRDPYSSSIHLSWLNHFDRSTISALKWVFTLVFTIVHLGLAMAILWLWFGERKYLRWLVLFYGVVFVLAGAIFIFGKLTGTHDATYQVTRKLMGALQSAVPLMVFFPVVIFHRRLDNSLLR
ncbi:hypothetical protein [Halocola ammonii]